MRKHFLEFLYLNEGITKFLIRGSLMGNQNNIKNSHRCSDKI